MYKLCLAPSDEGAVDCKLTVRQFTFYKSTEGGKNYKLDELIGYYLINLYYINNSTNPNLSYHLYIRNREITNSQFYKNSPLIKHTVIF